MCQTVTWIKYWDTKIVGIEKVNVKFSDPMSVESLSVGVESDESSWSLEYYGSIDMLSNQEWRIKCQHMIGGENPINEAHHLYLRRDNKKWTGNLDSTPISFSENPDYIDISSSPFTNYFPIISMNNDGSRDKNILTTYIHVPSLKISFVEQCYEKIKQGEYTYRAKRSDKKYTIKTDNYGLVEEYDNIWKRLS